MSITSQIYRRVIALESIGIPRRENVIVIPIKQGVQLTWGINAMLGQHTILSY